MVQPPFNALKIVARILPDVIVTAWKLPRGFAGISRVSPYERSILHAWNLDPVEAQPVVAHEIGHFLTNLARVKRGERACAAPGVAERFDIIHIPEDETFCDLFAGEVLVPSARLLEDLDGIDIQTIDMVRQRNLRNRLAGRYGVPATFMGWRMKCARRLVVDPRFETLGIREALLLATTAELEPVLPPPPRVRLAKAPTSTRRRKVG